MKYLFWGCLGLIAYTYLIYPALVMAFARLFPRSYQKDDSMRPSVSMLVSAYNEEDVIQQKLENCLQIEYPQDRIEFLLGSDGSSDGTNAVLEGINPPRFRTFLFPEREGKSAVINRLLPEAKGEIILFSDANSMYCPDAVNKLVRHFSDPAVGGVCGKLRLIDPQGTAGGDGEGLYWRFENAIKRAEGALHSVVSANGAIFTVRKELLDPLPTHTAMNDDLLITMQIMKKGKRVIYEPGAVAEENTSPSMGKEFERKIRISSCNYPVLPWLFRHFRPRHAYSGWALFSHKFLRWSVPFLGMGMLVSNLLLAFRGGVYPYFLAGQGLVYLGALFGFLGDLFFDDAGPFIPFYYLAMVNAALVIGLWRILTGRQGHYWERLPR